MGSGSSWPKWCKARRKHALRFREAFKSGARISSWLCRQQRNPPSVLAFFLPYQGLAASAPKLHHASLASANGRGAWLDAIASRRLAYAALKLRRSGTLRPSLARSGGALGRGCAMWRVPLASRPTMLPSRISKSHFYASGQLLLVGLQMGTVPRCRRCAFGGRLFLFSLG